MRSRLILVAVLVISVSVGLSLVEVALRLMGSFTPPSNPIRSPQAELYHADPNVGYRLWPSRTTSARYPKTSKELISIASNSDGFRSREFDEPDTRPRILVVGDSFVFGLGVKQEDRLTEQLERIDPKWRVDNMGMTGWGLDLMVRAIEQYGRKAKPDVLVLAVYTDDLRRLHPYYAGAGFGYEKFELRDSELVTVPFPYPRFWERLRVVQMLYQSVWRLDKNRFDLNQALLDRFVKDSSAIGAKPVVAFLPGTFENEEDNERRDFVRDWTIRNGIPYADLTDAILNSGVKDAFITDNWHWSPVGHRIAAEQLRGVLQQLPQLAATAPVNVQ